jgi:hypothetical protein
MKMKQVMMTLIVLAIAGLLFAGYETTKVYNAQGGDEIVIASGGKITVQSGGTLAIESGGTMTVGATTVTASSVITTTTTPVAVTAANSGATYVSYGVAATAADCVFTLPTAAAGLTYTFVDANATAADDLWVTAAAGDKINGGTAAKSFKNTGDVYGAGVKFIAIDATNWIAIPGAIGTWANDNN